MDTSPRKPRTLLSGALHFRPRWQDSIACERRRFRVRSPTWIESCSLPAQFPPETDARSETKRIQQRIPISGTMEGVVHGLASISDLVRGIASLCFRDQCLDAGAFRNVDHRGVCCVGSLVDASTGCAALCTGHRACRGR